MSVTADHFADAFDNTFDKSAAPAQTPYAPPASKLEVTEADSGIYPSIFSPRGRIGRLQLMAYNTAMYVLMAIALSVAVAVTGIATGATSSEGVMAALTIGFYVPIIALSFIWTIKRCHDFNASGWWSLASFIPLVNLVFLVIPGTVGGNDHGFKRANRWYHWIGVVAIVGVAVLGILAAVAIPMYQDYALRAAGAG